MKRSAPLLYQGLPWGREIHAAQRYRSFGIGVHRKHKLKWPFPQEKGPFDDLKNLCKFRNCPNRNT
jgi:hypothetical protein